ncbi:MAG: putative 4-hydroxybenzoate polyprenyltransferase [Trueperaceae bacterium]|nr:putative 4-hydroxybenzoate polyprenyltransferase [Trueperaceae bacterium]
MTAPAPRRRTLAAYLRLVRFQHTLFALPFAYAGMWLAADGFPGWATFGWVTLAMAGARTFAMAVNRVLDARIDAANPRTATREIPSGVLGVADGWLLAGVGLIAFVAAGLALNPLTAALLPVAAVFLAVYPLVKRVSWWCHAWLGVTIGAAAAGGWIAVTGAFAPPVWWLWLGVGAWIAGFDVVYAMLDRRFDQAHGVHSVPARFGDLVAARIAVGAHVLAVAALVLLAPAAGLGAIYLAAVAVVAAVLGAQHVWVARHGPAAALRAFDANLVIGLLVLVGVVADHAARGAGG